MVCVSRSLTTLALLVALAMPARAAVDLTGTWTVYTDVVPGAFTWELQQSGTALGSSFLGGTIDPDTGAFVLYPMEPGPCPQVFLGQARADGNAFSGVIRDSVMTCPGGIGTCRCDVGPNVLGGVNGCRDGAGACCGDAVVDPGEQCDDGPQASGSCCDGTCTIAVGQSCTSDADVCTADVCDAAGACTHLPEPDTDGDGVCDPADACPTGGCCGDGVVDPGEQCDDGPPASGGCCESCLLVASGTACAADAEACTLDVCDGAGTCVHPVADADGDGTCDALDVCPDGGALERAKVKLSRFTTPVGDDRVGVKGEMTIPTPPAPDPVADGLRLQIAHADGSVAFDATIPAGAWVPALRTGWKVNRNGTAFTFRGPTARAKLASVESTPGRYEIAVKLVAQALPGVAASIGVTVVLAPPVASGGQCGQTTFATCTVGRGGATLTCK